MYRFFPHRAPLPRAMMVIRAFKEKYLIINTELLDQWAGQCGFNGTVGLRQGGRELYRAYGLRDRAEGLPNGPNTAFGCASATKFFTALAAGRLIDQGRLRLDATVGELSPEFSGFIDPAATIEQLLRHRSGCYDYLDEELIEDYDTFELPLPPFRLLSPMDYLPMFRGHAPKFARGERASYSNGAYVILAACIELAASEPYQAYAEREVLARAGMSRSGFYRLDALPGDTAKGYLGDGLETNVYRLPVRGGGDGGLYLSAPDLTKAWAAFQAGKILSPDLMEAFTRPVVDAAPVDAAPADAAPAMGCGLTVVREPYSFSISGYDLGVGAFSAYWPGSGDVVTVLSNRTGGDGDMLKLMLEGLKTG